MAVPMFMIMRVAVLAVAVFAMSVIMTAARVPDSMKVRVAAM